MVTKGKLKMALAAEKGTDFGKLHLKKKEKAANKKNQTKGGAAKALKSNGKKVEEEWEDVDGGDESEDGGVALSEEDSGSEDEAEEGMKIDFAALDESDSDSSAGENDQENAEDDSDDEDIPISDLEDLDDEDKEDIIPHQRLTINNTIALTSALKRIALPTSKLPFSEHQSVTTSAPVSIPDVSDDLSRELAFYAQCLSAAQEGRKLLKAEGVMFTRPNDYFAEMVKADEHMAKIKARLIEEAAGKKASAEARKQRDLKKFGKQVQVAKLQERDKERKQTLEKIKVLKRKRQDTTNEATTEADMFDVALEDETSKPSGSRGSRGDRGDRGDRSNKRTKKDAKYGHGGKKRYSKSGDAMSSGDLTGFSSKKMKGSGGGGGRGGARGSGGRGGKARPGKARRAGMK